MNFVEFLQKNRFNQPLDFTKKKASKSSASKQIKAFGKWCCLSASALSAQLYVSLFEQNMHG